MAVANSPSAAISRVVAFINKANSKMVMDFSSFFVGLNWPDVREARADKGKQEGPHSRRHAGRSCTSVSTEASRLGCFCTIG